MHKRIALVALLPLLSSGCAAVTVVETAVDVTAAGVKAVVGSEDEDKE